MRLIRFIPEHRRSLVKELITFGLVGGFNTAFGMVLFEVFFALGALTANTISTAIATIGSFLLNRNVTYRKRARTPLRRELPLFALLNLIGLGIQLVVLDGGRRLFEIDSADRLDLSYVRIGSVLVGTVFLLLTYRTFVFKNQSIEAEAAIVSVVPVEIIADSDELIADPDDLVADSDALDDTEFELLTDPLEAEMRPAADTPAVATGLR